MKADVTEGPVKLAEVIGDDSDAVICATGFQRSWDLLAPWKVSFKSSVIQVISILILCYSLSINVFIQIMEIQVLLIYDTKEPAIDQVFLAIKQ